MASVSYWQPRLAARHDSDAASLEVQRRLGCAVVPSLWRLRAVPDGLEDSHASGAIDGAFVGDVSWRCNCLLATRPIKCTPPARSRSPPRGRACACMHRQHSGTNYCATWCAIIRGQESLENILLLFRVDFVSYEQP